MYKKFTDSDLIRVYNTMMENEGKISNDLQKEMDLRGGVDYYQRILTFRQTQPEEFARLQQDIRSLTAAETDPGLVRTFVSSGALSETDLDNFVMRTFTEYKDKATDEKIDRTTIIQATAGALAGIIPAAVFWYALMCLIKEPVTLAIPVVFMLALFTIKLVTKKSFKNSAVLIATILAGLAALLIGHFLYTVTVGHII